MPVFLTRRQVAERYPLSLSYLQKAGMKDPPFAGPPFAIVGKNAIYTDEGVVAFLNAKVGGGPLATSKSVSAPSSTPTPAVRRGRPRKSARA